MSKQTLTLSFHCDASKRLFLKRNPSVKREIISETSASVVIPYEGNSELVRNVLVFQSQISPAWGTLSNPTPQLLDFMRAGEWMIEALDGEAHRAMEKYHEEFDIFNLEEKAGKIVVGHPDGDSYRNEAHKRAIFAGIERDQDFLTKWGDRLTLCPL